MREYLITKFVCAKCGNNLKLSYDIPCGAGKYSSGEPTGAAMVEQLVVIEPCECITKPMQKIQDAINMLAESTKLRRAE